MLKSKGKTLLYLKKKKFNVPDLFIFKANSFLKNKDLVLNKIIKKFNNKKIAIRSSSIEEDTLKTTNAGKFQSFLNVTSSDKKQVTSKIFRTIQSYKKNSKLNEVIIQKMLHNVNFSGVCTTIDIHNFLPVTTINYHKGKDTEIVTSGKKNSYSISISNIKYLNKKHRFYKLLTEVEKLKKIFKTDLLDIEFAIDDKKKIHILQVRRLILPKKKKLVDKKFYFQNLKRLEKKIKKLQEKHYELHGDTNCFGVMPDWNPAEIIGTKPRPLALSMYKELITDHIWAKHRYNYGYKDLSSHHLMTNFFGTPYIDVRVDFNSWIPKNLNSIISKKLINFYLKKFKKNKNYHDKIEFKILFTCFTPNTTSRLKNELNETFDKKEILKIKNSLKVITRNTINNMKVDSIKIEKLEKKFYELSKSKINNINKIYYLMEECKKDGTLAFAGLARCAFVAVDILNSLVDKNVLSTSEKNNFLNSISNIATKVNNDFLNLSKQKFCEINGHLRPNTYDIVTLNYKEGYDIYFSDKKKLLNTNKRFFFSAKQKLYINNFIKNNGLKLNLNKFISFLKDSIYLREYSKFIFTKYINLIFDNLIAFGKKYRISRDDLSYLDISSILNLHDTLDSLSIISILKDSIKKNKKIYNDNALIQLPDTITSIKDLYVYKKNLLSGNFITQKLISGELVELKNFKNIKKIENKIILIESADPGYDFIFSKKIKGLVTKFGGQNSHMSIRSSELSLPAAIGVGDDIYNFLKNKKYITLDCLNKKIF